MFITKVAALDLGDRWIGVALSDPLKMFARPFATIERYQLENYLTQFIKEQNVETIVVGIPHTLRGTASEQTQKVLELFTALQQKFPDISWAPWDERLTSKEATRLGIGQKMKHSDHARAASIILNAYLDFLRLQKNTE